MKILLCSGPSPYVGVVEVAKNDRRWSPFTRPSVLGPVYERLLVIPFLLIDSRNSLLFIGWLSGGSHTCSNVDIMSFFHLSVYNSEEIEGLGWIHSGRG